MNPDEPMFYSALALVLCLFLSLFIVYLGGSQARQNRKKQHKPDQDAAALDQQQAIAEFEMHSVVNSID